MSPEFFQEREKTGAKWKSSHAEAFLIHALARSLVHSLPPRADVSPPSYLGPSSACPDGRTDGRSHGHRRASEPGQSVNVLLLNGELELQNVTSLVSTEGEKLRFGMATVSVAAATRRRTRIGVSSSDCQAHV